jgi:hypothetical protein
VIPKNPIPENPTSHLIIMHRSVVMMGRDIDLMDIDCIQVNPWVDIGVAV